MSSGDLALIDLLVPTHEDAEDFPRNVALEAADGLELRGARGDAAGDVVLRSLIQPQSTDGNDMDRAVRGSVTAPVQPVPHGLPRRRRYRAGGQC